MRAPILSIIAAGLAALAAAAAPVGRAAAQTATPPPVIGNTVATRTAIPDIPPPSDPAEADRVRDALRPIGARWGALTLYPTLEAQLAYNDNIYAVADRTGDAVARFSPSAVLRLDAGRVTGAARVSLDRYRYANRTGENRTDQSAGWTVAADGPGGLVFGAAGGISQAHEDRGDPNAVSSARRPTRYRLGELAGSLTADRQRIGWGLEASRRRFRFDDGRQPGGAGIDNGDRDRVQWRVAGHLGISFSPGYRVVARGGWARIGYDRAVDDAGYRRSATERRATLGVEAGLTRLLTGELFAGALRRRFDDPRFPTITTPVFGASLGWRPTPLTTLRLDADRTIQETVIAGTSSYRSTGGTLAVEHELLRTVILTARVRLGRDAYQRAIDAPVPCHVDNTGAFAGVRYLLNRTLFAGLSFDWTRRRSNIDLPGFNFTRRRATATLGVQL